MGKQKSLTEPPKDLKEAIDWLALVGGGFGTTSLGTGKYSELGKRLEELQGFNTAAQNTLPISNYEGIIKKLAEGLGYGFLGYSGQETDNFSGSGIVASNGGYISTYRYVQWQDDQKSDYALIFLGSAYVTYYFLTFLYWACSNNYSGPWKGLPLQDHQRPGIYLKGMGFYIDTLVRDKWSYNLANDLDSGYNGFTELNVSNSYFNNLTYSKFLTTLQRKAPTDAINCPLTSLYLLAHHYFSLNPSSDVTRLMKQIKGNFLKLGGYGNDDYQTLKTQIKEFLSKVKTFTPTPPPLPPQPPQSGASTTSSPQSSSAGPAVGGLVGVGALGAGAAYGLNLGGAKTLVNGLLHLR
ncbi:variant erythrocyte surface antigen-1 family protein [Babesia caballi]|uniref:Variant erythrocyte surface antigen-1 family protein n=1 Tax=Babesia caballi TaxID=5871 RepID=A0AAV4LVB6_BABCB|nr:variant erythrocyte surface antigen-1 family protein [Babesia caballi]